MVLALGCGLIIKCVQEEERKEEMDDKVKVLQRASGDDDGLWADLEQWPRKRVK